MNMTDNLRHLRQVPDDTAEDLVADMVYAARQAEEAVADIAGQLQVLATNVRFLVNSTSALAEAVATTRGEAS